VITATAAMISAGATITASNRNGITFDLAERPRPNAPRRLCRNSDRAMYAVPSRGPS
jgi:hypothetical protein